MGALLGDEVVYAGQGDSVLKPRGQWHTFWNPSDEPARICEFIVPGGFERFFFALLEFDVDPSPTDLDSLGELYGLQSSFNSIGALCREHGLWFA